ncbi:C2H2-type zinc finger transcription factor [Mucor lusitanicus]|uniref:C2H2-type zinc finger transcription factor n=2 Tax=Mucor circinelloides f. lusitanicus TaxID=29924 RepID=A0A162YJ36_MUCCL|nr:C2H2-type zinc finger transcription factor [Mucor lusitanicus]OAC98886.1 C2H2-type zinc finger transcription factor [Mucor lusitanicus CBS 277.49]
MSEEDSNFACPQCPKIFATRSNLKRHMENPNIHNIPYARSRDQKRWSGHTKKVSSRADTTERMRKWRAENRDKNKRNDLRCRVYRLARQKFGEGDSEEKQQFINEEINRRLGRRMLLEQKSKENAASHAATATSDASSNANTNTFRIRVKDEFNSDALHTRSPSITPPQPETLNELPFYCAPLHKIELPSINMNNRRPSQSTEPSGYINKSQPPSPMSDTARHEDDASRRLSGCSINSSSSSRSLNYTTCNTTTPLNNTTHNPINDKNNFSPLAVTTSPEQPHDTLPPMLALLPPVSGGNSTRLPLQ